MELRQLEYFREIANTGSINEAARKLNMSQPPLSYQIRQLENELNVQLFERTHKGVILTAAGKLLYDRAASLLDYARSTELEVSQTGKKRVLRIGITYTLYDYLQEGIIDISVVRTPLRLDDVESAVLHSEPMIAVSNPEMPSERRKSLILEDLVHRPLILYRRYEKLIMDAFHAQNLVPEVFCLCDDARGATLWVKEGLATAIFPQSMEPLCEGLACQVLDEPDLVTKILLIWQKGRKPTAVVQDFMDVCLK